MRLGNRTGIMIVAILVVSSPALAASEFTAIVAQSTNRFLIAGKNHSQGFEPAPFLIELDAATGKALNLELPKEAQGRDIIALFAEKDRYFVVTQLRSEQGDEPLPFSYGLKDRKWKKLKPVDCPSVVAIRTVARSLVFKCEGQWGSQRGVIEKSFPVSSMPFRKNSEEVVLPQAEAVSGRTKGVLQREGDEVGLAYFNAFRLQTDAKSAKARTYTPQSLIKAAEGK